MSFPKHPGVNSSCPQCQGQSYLLEPGSTHAVARLCDCVGTCPMCKGTGFRRKSGERTAPLTRCACAETERRLGLLTRAHLPTRHAGSALSTFTPPGEFMPQFVRINQYVKDFVPGETSLGLVLYGDVGRGKTHLMVGIVRQLVLEYGVEARFIEFSMLLQDLKSAFDRGTGAADLLEPLTHVQVLAIDELGKGRRTDFEISIIDDLISRRYNHMLPLLATTNYAPGRATGRATPNLARPDERVNLVDRLDERIYSRLVEMADLVPVTGQDHRRKLARQRHRG